MVLHEWSRWRGVGAASVLLGALLFSMLTAENSQPADGAATADALPSDLAKIPSDGCMAVSVRIADLWVGDLLKSMRQNHPKEIEFVFAEFKKYIGLSLEQMERTTMVLLDPISIKGDQLFFLRTIEPYDLNRTRRIVRVLQVCLPPNPRCSASTVCSPSTILWSTTEGHGHFGRNVAIFSPC